MIVLDPGHGGSVDRGKSEAFGRTHAGRAEKDVTLDVARRLAQRIGGAVLTRDRDENISLAQRIRYASGASAFVSLHAHGGEAEVWSHPRANPASERLAAQMAASLGVARRSSELAVLCPDGHGETAAVLVALPEHGDVVEALADALAVFDNAGNRATHDTANIQAFQQWVIGQVMPAASANNQNQQQRLAARQVLTNLGNALPGNPPAHHELIAASAVVRAQDNTIAAAPVALVDNAGPARLRNLARREWYRLFIEQVDQAQNADTSALVYDNQQSPGFYASMMRAMNAWCLVQPNGAPLQRNWQTYQQMHADAVNGVMHQVNQQWQPIAPNVVQGVNVFYPIARPNEAFTEAGLLDLIQTGIAAVHPADVLQALGQQPNPQAPAHLLAYHRLAIATNTACAVHQGDNQPQYLARLVQANFRTVFRMNFGPNNAFGGIQGSTIQPANAQPGRIGATFQTLAQQLQVAGQLQNAQQREPARINAIARCVRDLHVSHVFVDANGRLNTMLLLNRLLQDEGMSPAIIPDHGIFGGRFSVAQLAQAITNGINAFRQLVPVQMNVG